MTVSIGQPLCNIPAALGSREKWGNLSNFACCTSKATTAGSTGMREKGTISALQAMSESHDM